MSSNSLHILERVVKGSSFYNLGSYVKMLHWVELGKPDDPNHEMFDLECNPDWIDWVMGIPVGWSDINKSISKSKINDWKNKLKKGIWWKKEPVKRLVKKNKNTAKKISLIGNGQVPLQVFYAWNLLMKSKNQTDKIKNIKGK